MTSTAMACSNLAVAPFGRSASVTVLLGNGDGSFQPARRYNTGASPASIATADFDGDGIVDIAAATPATDSVVILLGNGDGSFASGRWSPAGKQPFDVATGDFDGDGATDLVVANSSLPRNVSVLLGYGDGWFQPFVGYDVRDPATSVVVEESRPATGASMSQYRQLDPAAGTFPSSSAGGDGTFRPLVRQRVPRSIQTIATPDVNSDGAADLVVADTAVSILLGNGDGTFQTPLSYAAGLRVGSVGAGDFDGDGRLDVAAANTGSSNVSILLGNGDGTLQATQVYGHLDDLEDIIIGDFDGDGTPDLAGAGSTTGTGISILLGNGDGTFQPAIDYFAGPNPANLVATDLNGNGALDLTATTFGVTVLLGNGDGTFQPPTDYLAGYLPESLAVADFDQDTALDIAVACNGSHEVFILLGNGDGTFQAASLVAAVLGPISMTSGDFNRDGTLDLGVLSDGVWSNDVSILLGNGNGTFQPAASYPGFVAEFLTSDDLNGDGVVDLAIPLPGLDTIAVLAGQGDGTFGSPGFHPTGAYPKGGRHSRPERGRSRPTSPSPTRGPETLRSCSATGPAASGLPSAFQPVPIPDRIAVGDLDADGLVDLAVSAHGAVALLAETGIALSPGSPLPDGETGVPYSLTFSAQGGSPPPLLCGHRRGHPAGPPADLLGSPLWRPFDARRLQLLRDRNRFHGVRRDQSLRSDDPRPAIQVRYSRARAWARQIRTGSGHSMPAFPTASTSSPTPPEPGGSMLRRETSTRTDPTNCLQGPVLVRSLVPRFAHSLPTESPWAR